MAFQYNFFSGDPKHVALEKMILLRQTEKFISDLHKRKVIGGPCHFGIGQEAISVAISDIINHSTDNIFASHRSHNPYLAITLDVFGLLAELARKPFGCSKGKGGSTYLTNPEKGFICSTPILTGGLGLATGAAFAEKQKARNGIAVVFFGDGAVEEGIFHEALNFSSVFSLPLFFVCENNSYSCNVDIKHRQPQRKIQTLAEAHGIVSDTADGNDYFQLLDKIKNLASICRGGQQPVFLEAKTFRMSSHTGTDDKRDIGVLRDRDEISYWQQRDPIKNFLCSTIDGEAHLNSDMCSKIEIKVNQFLERAWQKIEQHPSVEIENNQINFVYSKTSTFPEANCKSKNFKPSGGEKSFLQGLQEGVSEILFSDPNILFIGQGVSSPWDSGKLVYNSYNTLRNTQIFESPNSESVTTAVGIGLAMSGIRCIVNHPRMDFLILATDSIINQAAKAFYMSGGKLKVPIVIRAQLYRGNGQGAQHSQALYSLFSHIPGLRVVVPSTPSDARNLLFSSVFSDDPVLYIDDKWLHDWTLEYEKIDNLTLKDEGPRVLLPGQHITLVGIGYTTRLCYEAAQDLATHGILCEVIDLRILNPLDCNKIIQSCRKTRALLVVDLSWPQCSVSSEIIAQVSESLFSEDYKVQLHRMHTHNVPAPASTKGEHEFYIDKPKVKSKIYQILKEQ